MKLFRKILASSLLLVAGAVSLSAESRSTSVRFRFGKAEADASALEQLLAGPDSSRIVGVEVRASSSPDGPYWVNKTLAENRATFIINKVKELCPSLGEDAVKSTVVAEDWSGVARWLRRSGKAWKDEALKIVTEAKASDREEKLQDLYAGEAWDDMMRSAFPALRSVKVTVVYADAETETVVSEEEKPASKATLEANDAAPRILFSAGMRYVDPKYENNATVIEAIGKLLAEGKSLKIEAFSSPEGAPAANATLAKNRANCVRSFLAEKFAVPESRISVVCGGEDWAGLAREVEADYTGANRDELVKILSDESLSGPGKKAAIRALDGGATWRSLVESKMKALRAACVEAQ